MGNVFGKQFEKGNQDKKDIKKRLQSTKQMKRFSTVMIGNSLPSKPKKHISNEKIDDQINLLQIKEAESNSVSSNQSEENFIQFNSKQIDFFPSQQNVEQIKSQSSDSIKIESVTTSNKSKTNQFKRYLKRKEEQNISYLQSSLTIIQNLGLNLFHNNQKDSLNMPSIAYQRRRSFVKSNTQICEPNQLKIFDEKCQQKQEQPNLNTVFLQTINKNALILLNLFDLKILFSYIEDTQSKSGTDDQQISQFKLNNNIVNDKIINKDQSQIQNFDSKELILFGLYKSSIIFEIILLLCSFSLNFISFFSGNDYFVGYDRFISLILYMFVSGLITLQVFLGYTQENVSLKQCTKNVQAKKSSFKLNLASILKNNKDALQEIIIIAQNIIGKFSKHQIINYQFQSILLNLKLLIWVFIMFIGNDTDTIFLLESVLLYFGIIWIFISSHHRQIIQNQVKILIIFFVIFQLQNMFKITKQNNHISIYIINLLIKLITSLSLFFMSLLPMKYIEQKINKINNKHSEIIEMKDKKADYQNKLIEQTSKRLIICKLYQISSDITRRNSIKMKKDKSKLNKNIFIESLEQKEYCIQINHISNQFKFYFPSFCKKLSVTDIKEHKIQEMQHQKIKVQFRDNEDNVFGILSPDFQNQQISRKLNFMNEQIFQPFLISNFMILKYESMQGKMFSIKQILVQQDLQLNNKVVEEHGNRKAQQICFGDKQIALYFKTVKSKTKNFQEFYDNDSDKKKSEEKFSQQYNKVIKKRSQSFNKNQTTNKSQTTFESHDAEQLEDEFMYFKFSIKSVTDWKNPNEKQIMIMIRDITKIIQTQKKICDKMYQDAIETNYSHEQMTPLNSIINNSQLLEVRLQELIKFEEENCVNDNKCVNDQAKNLLKHVQYSGQIMWFYNQNQIQRMKIRKGEFLKKLFKTFTPQKYIVKAIKPFSPFLKNRQINVHIFQNYVYDEIMSLQGDWKMFSFAIFNLIQNSVKYNKFKGDIFILISLQQISEEKIQKNIQKMKQLNQKNLNNRIMDENANIILNKIFQVDVIDSGLGIEKERQNYLFIPFQELKAKESIQNVKNQSIGMGLACAHLIMKELGGSLHLLESQPGRTVFRMQMPINHNSQYLEDVSYHQGQKGLKSDVNFQSVFNFKRLVSPLIQQYLIEQIGENIINFQDLASAEFDVNQSIHKINSSNQIIPSGKNIAVKQESPKQSQFKIQDKLFSTSKQINTTENKEKIKKVQLSESSFNFSDKQDDQQILKPHQKNDFASKSFMMGGSEKSLSSLNKSFSKSLNKDQKNKMLYDKFKIRKISKQNQLNKKKSMMNANVQSLFGKPDQLKLINLREKQNIINQQKFAQQYQKQRNFFHKTKSQIVDGNFIMNNLRMKEINNSRKQMQEASQSSLRSQFLNMNNQASIIESPDMLNVSQNSSNSQNLILGNSMYNQQNQINNIKRIVEEQNMLQNNMQLERNRIKELQSQLQLLQIEHGQLIESQLIINERRNVDNVNIQNKKKSSQSLIAFSPKNRLNDLAIDIRQNNLSKSRDVYLGQKFNNNASYLGTQSDNNKIIRSRMKNLIKQKSLIQQNKSNYVINKIEIQQDFDIKKRLSDSNQFAIIENQRNKSPLFQREFSGQLSQQNVSLKKNSIVKRFANANHSVSFNVNLNDKFQNISQRQIQKNNNEMEDNLGISLKNEILKLSDRVAKSVSSHSFSQDFAQQLNNKMSDKNSSQKKSNNNNNSINSNQLKNSNKSIHQFLRSSQNLSQKIIQIQKNSFQNQQNSMQQIIQINQIEENQINSIIQQQIELQYAEQQKIIDQKESKLNQDQQISSKQLGKVINQLGSECPNNKSESLNIEQRQRIIFEIMMKGKLEDSQSEQNNSIEKSFSPPPIITNLDINTSYSGKLSFIIDDIIDNPPQYRYYNLPLFQQRPSLKKPKLISGVSLSQNVRISDYQQDLLFEEPFQLNKELEISISQQIDISNRRDSYNKINLINEKKKLKILSKASSKSYGSNILKSNKNQIQNKINCLNNSSDLKSEIMSSGNSGAKSQNHEIISRNSGKILSQSCYDITLMLGNAAILRSQNPKHTSIDGQNTPQFLDDDNQSFNSSSECQSNSKHDESYERILNQNFNAIQEVQEQDEMSMKQSQQFLNQEYQQINNNMINSKINKFQKLSNLLSLKNSSCNSIEKLLIQNIKKKVSNDVQNKFLEGKSSNNSLQLIPSLNNSTPQSLDVSLSQDLSLPMQISKKKKKRPILKANSFEQKVGSKKQLQEYLKKGYNQNSEQIQLSKCQSQNLMNQQCKSNSIKDINKISQDIKLNMKKSSKLEKLHKLHKQQSSKIEKVELLIDQILKSKRQKDSSSKIKEGCNCVPKIMLVDDNEFNLMPLQILISQLFQIKTELAFSGSQALSLFKENYEKQCKCENRGYKFIFMDLNMPDIDGYEASELILNILKSDQNQDYTHIVALTSYTGQDVKDKCTKIGMKGMINKPLNHKDLQRMVYLHFYRLTIEQFNERFPNLK